jgi:hypothetical protein
MANSSTRVKGAADQCTLNKKKKKLKTKISHQVQRRNFDVDTFHIHKIKARIGDRDASELLSRQAMIFFYGRTSNEMFNAPGPTEISSTD